MARKYSKGFERDFNWYLSVRHKLNFDGRLDRDIKYDPKGVDGKRAFQLLDSQGKLVPTKHPNILRSVLKTKGSTNLHIKMYAEDRARGILPKILFHEEIVEPLNCPDWFIEAVERQKNKYY